MPFTTEIRRIMAGVLIAFGLVGLSAGYWASVGADTILQRADNPRLVEREARIQRGAIYDRHEVMLVDTVSLSRRVTQRIYHELSTFSALGYYSLRYGAGGLEASFDDILRGNTIAMTVGRYFSEQVLHQAPQGSDIRLTLDKDLQESIIEAMGDSIGAVVVMGSDGGIMGLVSQPSFNPNTLDDDWVTLVADERKPFFNRATQGQYQPGGVMQTPLMTVALLTGQLLNEPIEDAMLAVQLDELLLTCSVTPPEGSMLTLTDAYAYGCPSAYKMLIETLPTPTLLSVVDSFGLNQVGRVDFLGDVPLANEDVNAVLQDGVLQDTVETDLVKRLLGQGDLTVNPLAVTMMSLSLINEGSSPTPYMLDSIRAPEGNWETVTSIAPRRAFMTDSTARRLQDMWISHVRQVSSFQVLAREEARIGVHSASALSGDTDILWLTGFIVTSDGAGYAFTITLENGAMVELLSIADAIITALMTS